MALYMLDRVYDEVSVNRLTSKQAFNSKMQVVLIFNMWKQYKPDTNLANVTYNNRPRRFKWKVSDRKCHQRPERVSGDGGLTKSWEKVSQAVVHERSQ